MAVPVRKEQLREISCRDFFRQHVGPLKQKGRRFWGNCPFHSEKTDSLVVDETRFHCFGCGADGDIFEMAKKVWLCGFFDAVQRLATEYGVTAETQKIPKRPERKPETLLAERIECVFEWCFTARLALSAELKRCGDDVPARMVNDMGLLEIITSELVGDPAQVANGLRLFWRWFEHGKSGFRNFKIG